jgi:FolB domain-containing protein
MDHILITDLLARGVIGITERERARPQDILINVVLHADISQAARSDDIADCVDYSVVARLLLAHAESAARQTVEALVSDLAEICLQQAGVQGVRIRVEKPGAVRFARSVGVEIERFRAS